jgi:hypothetical protein
MVIVTSQEYLKVCDHKLKNNVHIVMVVSNNLSLILRSNFISFAFILGVCRTIGSRKNSIDIFLKASGYLDCAIRHVLPQIGNDMRFSVFTFFVYLLVSIEN